MIQLGFTDINKPLNRFNKTGKQLHNLDNTVNRNSGFTLIEMAITSAIVGVLAAVAVPNYSDYIKRTKLVPCYGDTRILNLEYTIGQTGSYASTADLKDSILTKLKYTKVSDGVYNCPSCDDDVYANVSIDADDKLETSCSLEENATDDASDAAIEAAAIEAAAIEAAAVEAAAVEAAAVKAAIDAAAAAVKAAIDAATTIVLTGFSSAYVDAQKIISASAYPNKAVQGTELIDAYKAANGGSLTKVDSSLMTKAGLSGNLYWKANTYNGIKTETENTNYVLFASTTTSTTAGWNGSLAYYNKVYYKATAGTATTAIPTASTTSKAAVIAWLDNPLNGWTKI